jgi:hypothetical protein
MCSVFNIGRTEEIHFMRICSPVAAVVLALVALPAVAVADGEWEHWSQIQVTGAINEVVRFSSSAEVRLDEAGGHHYYTRMGSDVSWAVTDYAAVGAGYEHVNTRSGDGWAVESRPYFSLTFRTSLPELSLSDRSKLEWRMKENNTTIRYRNKLTLKGPLLTRLMLRPFAAGEVFYDTSEGRLEKQRVLAGLTLAFWRRIEISVHYMLEERRSGGAWASADVIGTTLTYNF